MGNVGVIGARNLEDLGDPRGAEDSGSYFRNSSSPRAFQELIMGLHRDYLGLYRGYIGIMEKKIETTV